LIITFLSLALALRSICRVCPSIFNCQRPQSSVPRLQAEN